jgi:hypothetical protein
VCYAVALIIAVPRCKHVISVCITFSSSGSSSSSSEFVGFEVLTAVSMKMAVFWVVAPCCLVDVYQRLRGACWRDRRSDSGGSKHL